MYCIGGYVLTFEDAKEWALRRWPDIEFNHDALVPNTITRYSFNTGENITCVAVRVRKEPRCIFITNEIHDPTATRIRHKRFRESEFQLRCKRHFFPTDDYNNIAEFITICDPFEIGR
jgi:hypothetical protein